MIAQPNRDCILQRPISFAFSSPKALFTMQTVARKRIESNSKCLSGDRTDSVENNARPSFRVLPGMASMVSEGGVPYAADLRKELQIEQSFTDRRNPSEWAD